MASGDAPKEAFEGKTSVITCDMNGIVQEYAADAAALFGWSQDEVIGKMSVAMFHVPRNVPTLVPRLLREAVEKGKFEEEVVLMRKDASTFRARLTVRPLVRDGTQVGFMGMTHPLEPPGEVPVGRLWFQALRVPFLIAARRRPSRLAGRLSRRPRPSRPRVARPRLRPSGDEHGE